MANPPTVVPARNPGFYTAARNFVQESLRLLQRVIGDHPKWPTVESRHIVFEPNRSYFQPEIVTTPATALNQIMGEIQNLPSYHAAVQELERASERGDPLPNFGGLGPQYVLPIISNYLKAHSSLAFNDAWFTQAYYPVEEYLTGNTSRVCLYCALTGLGGDLGEVVLSTTHRIYRLDETEINRLWRLVEPPWFPAVLRGGFGTQYPMPGSYVLSATVDYPKSKFNELGLILQNEERIASRALRLSAPGVGAVLWFTYEHLSFAPDFMRIGSGLTLKPSTYSFQLNEEVGECLKQHWAVAYELSSALELPREKTPAHIRICAQRFNLSSDKLSNEDQLIDFSIALEALLTKENDSVSYRLALRGSIIAGDTPDERRRTYAVLKAAYDIRSNLAHGKDQLAESVKVDGHKMPIAPFIKELRGVLFKILHRFIRARRLHGKDSVLKETDESIVSMSREDLQQLWL